MLDEPSNDRPARHRAKRLARLSVTTIIDASDDISCAVRVGATIDERISKPRLGWLSDALYTLAYVTIALAPALCLWPNAMAASPHDRAYAVCGNGYIGPFDDCRRVCARYLAFGTALGDSKAECICRLREKPGTIHCDHP